jgi:anti-sigma factor (TIGR02949 family)
MTRTTTLDCESAMRRLWEYLDSALPEPDLAAIRTHVEACASCREHMEFERWLLAAVRAARTPTRARVISKT